MPMVPSVSDSVILVYDHAKFIRAKLVSEMAGNDVDMIYKLYFLIFFFI